MKVVRILKVLTDSTCQEIQRETSLFSFRLHLVYDHTVPFYSIIYIYRNKDEKTNDNITKMLLTAYTEYAPIVNIKSRATIYDDWVVHMLMIKNMITDHKILKVANNNHNVSLTFHRLGLDHKFVIESNQRDRERSINAC